MPITNREDLVVGKTYRAKRPLMNWLGEYNDRTILYIGKSKVQYDSWTVRDGRHYPQVDIEAFLRWVKEEVEEDDGTKIEEIGNKSRRKQNG